MLSSHTHTVLRLSHMLVWVAEHPPDTVRCKIRKPRAKRIRKYYTSSARSQCLHLEYELNYWALPEATGTSHVKDTNSTQIWPGFPQNYHKKYQALHIL